jgi:site-specific recombinase XerC
MLDVSAMSIKELAGHVNLQTTQRYLHLSSRAKGQAISAFDAALAAPRVNTGETVAPGIDKLNA